MTDPGRLFAPSVRGGVLQLDRPGTEWLSTGWHGGRERAPTAYNVSVPEGWPEVDLGAYAAERRDRAGFERSGPTLFTGVSLEHLRGARLGAVEVYATAGLSNPAALPSASRDSNADDSAPSQDGDPGPLGTVNLLVGTERNLTDGALANLVAVAAEAKAATLLTEAGVPGTTTDAVVVGHDPTGDPAQFTGSTTPVGAATRACVREAVLGSLRSRYPDRAYPETVAAAEHGVTTDRRAAVFRP